MVFFQAGCFFSRYVFVSLKKIMGVSFEVCF